MEHLTSFRIGVALFSSNHPVFSLQPNPVQLLVVARRCRTDLSHALRDAARVAVLLGRRQTAWRLFAASLAEANRQHNSLEDAKTLEARGIAGKPLDWEESADDIAEGKYLRNALRVSSAIWSSEAFKRRWPKCSPR